MVCCVCLCVAQFSVIYIFEKFDNFVLFVCCLRFSFSIVFSWVEFAARDESERKIE